MDGGEEVEEEKKNSIVMEGVEWVFLYIYDFELLGGGDQAVGEGRRRRRNGVR